MRADEHNVPWWIGWAIALMPAAFAVAWGVAARSAQAMLIEAAVCTAALAAGMLIGFLFGVPRTSTEAGEKAAQTSEQAGAIQHRPSNSLEQVSDWLTKILFGVGLVEVRQLADALARMGRFISLQLNDEGAGASVIAQAGVIASATTGGLLTTFLIRANETPKHHDEKTND